jgi:ribosomal protein S18 acetylase RimI-like enzyme
LALWQRTEGMGLGSWDEAGPIGQFLERNPGLSVVAEADGRLVGAVLCGHDGRRGFLYHLAVDREFRGQGLGRKLAESCLDRLRALGLTRCHIVAYQSNAEGRRFWQHLGFRERPELLICSRDLGAEP